MYHIAPQGDQYEKNILAFKNTPTLTRNDYQEAEYEIQLAIAVAFGQDKVIDSKKIEWFMENEDSLDWNKAKEPTYARAQMMSLARLRDTDRTNIPVELDSTCSQRQIIAVLTGNAKTAMTCNIITSNNEIQDAYKLVANKMSEMSGLKFNRSQIKQSDMISGYGAGVEKIKEQLKEDLKEYYFEGVDQIFFDASNAVDPMANSVKEMFKAMWDDTKTEWNWTLPDGFKVTYKTQESRQITINPFGLGEVTLITNMIMPTSKSTGLGVNVIHSVDAYVCRQMVVRCPFEIITIHDGFRCLPHNAASMRKIYNKIMAEITDSTLLEDIIFELSGLKVSIKKEFCGSHVMNSEYAIS
jgi:DNA-directed RNA polymerase